MLAGQAREQCVYTTSFLSFLPSTVAQWLWPSPLVCSSLNFFFLPFLYSSARVPTLICADFLCLIFFPFFFSYFHDNAKSCRVNASFPFDGAPSFCSRKFSAVTPFSSPVSARWPTQFGKQMLSMWFIAYALSSSWNIHKQFNSFKCDCSSFPYYSFFIIEIIAASLVFTIELNRLIQLNWINK